MAIMLKFVRGATELSLQDSTSGAQLARGWYPNVQLPQPGGAPAPVRESLPVMVAGSSQDDMAMHIQALHEMQVWAALYMSDRMEQTPVWLHAQLNTETNARRALVTGIEITYDSGWYDPEAASFRQTLMLNVTRGPWEATAALTSNGVLAEDSWACLVMDYTASPGADVTGDIPARITKFELATQWDIDISEQYDRFWIGLRSARRHADLDWFSPIWECEATGGTLGTDALRVGDATASPKLPAGDTAVQVSGATVTAWANRLTLELGDITSDWEAQYGRFLALLRAKVSAGKWEVKLKFAYANGVMAGEGPTVEVDETLGWNWYEMGQHSIPQRDLHALPVSLIAASAEEKYQVQVWARRTSGSGTLDLDCIVQLPIDEGYAVVKGADMDYTVDNANAAYLNIGCAPEDTFQAVALIPDTPSLQAVPQLSVNNFYLQPGDGRAYIVYAGPDLSDIYDKISGSVQWVPRWLSLRGAE